MFSLLSGFLERLPRLAITLPGLLAALTVHEFCHALAAFLCGDDTGKRMGRLSLNPFVHLDLAGTLCLIFLHFGWGKPVPFDPDHFRHPRRDLFFVSAAGVAGNLLCAAATALFLREMVRFCPEQFTALFQSRVWRLALFHFIAINIFLAIFNLLPVPPLDGSKIFYSILPERWADFALRHEQIMYAALLVMVFTGVTERVTDPVFEFCLDRVFEFIIAPAL